MSDQYDEVIRAFPLFEGFTAAGVRRLRERGEMLECRIGDVPFREGDDSDSVLLVIEGEIEVFVERRGRELVITASGPGTLVGDLGVLCGLQRSASVRATTESTILRWSDTTFRTILLGEVSLSQRVFKTLLRTLIEKERALIDSLEES